MVAAGATVLMAASEENLSNETGSSIIRSISQSTSNYNQLQHCDQRNIESPIKGDACSLNISKY